MALRSEESTLALSARGVLRLVIGLLFLCHGLQKVFGLFGGVDGHGAAIPLHESFNTLHGLSGVLEFAGGALILLGLFTRLVAFILCGEMAVAYFTAHFPGGFLPIVNHGELAVLYCFVFLYLSVMGGGAFSLDSIMRK